MGTPLSAMLRDAGAATVTVCHRIAYSNIFADRRRNELGALRASADACLPRLPGPTGMTYRLRDQNWAMDRSNGGLVGGEVWVKVDGLEGEASSVSGGKKQTDGEQNVTVSVSHQEHASTVEVWVRPIPVE